MSNDKSLNITPPSLPKGGGAIRSIGDGLGAVGARGAASYELPLPISPGRGFAPALALSYSSGVGNSPFGFGWSKTINAIARRASKGVPTYTDEDLFVGPDGVVLMPERDSRDGTVTSRTETHYLAIAVGSHQVTRFWPRSEGAFALIERWTADADRSVFWLIHTADGNLHLYGKTTDSRRADPDDPSRVAAWLIQESVDPRGQHVAYEYKPDSDPPNPDEPHDYRAQRFLSCVHYGNAQASEHLYSWAAAGWNDVRWHFHLVFDYGGRPHAMDAVPGYDEVQPWSTRTDAFSDYSYGFELRIRRLCHQVLMFHSFTQLSDKPVLVQRLLFEHRVTALGYTHLVAAHSQACDGEGRLHSRPPTEFAYQAFTPRLGTVGYQPFDAMPGLNDGLRYQLVDLFGEGMAGVLYRSDKAWYYRAPRRADPAEGPDQVAYDEWRELARIPAADSTKSVRQFLADITGDGSLDWVVSQPGWSGFFPCKTDGTWGTFTTLSAVPNEFFHPLAQMTDLMGAGLQDLVMIGPRSVRLYPSYRAEGFAVAQEVDRDIDDDRLPVFSDARNQLVAFADVLGSGQQHLVEVRHDQIKCWPNLGRGRFGKGFVWQKLPFTYDEFDASRILLADFDGSGAVDLVWLQPDCALIYMNRCGNGFDDEPLRLPWPSGVTWDRFCQVSAADLQGQGFSSLVLTVPHRDPRHWRCDLIQTKPYLLCATNNNLGAAGNIVYRSSAQEWLDEKAELKVRSAAAVSYLPFSMPLVSVQTQTDEITGNQLTQRFSYRNGFYDGVEREFLGFGQQISSDSETQAHAEREEGYTAPVLRKTWFHVGPELKPPRDDFFKGDPKAEPLGETLLSHYHQTDKVDQWVEADELARAHMRYALAGQISRSETYALDKPDGVPYAVEEHRYALRRLDPPIGGTHARYPVMQVLPLENITYQYEQDATDPMCQKTLSLAWDEFGNLTQGVAVAYARRLTAAADPACALDPGTIAPEKRWWCDAHDSAQQSYYLTETRAQFIHLNNMQGWRLGLPYVQRSNALVLKKGAGPDGLTPESISFEHFTASTPDNPLNLSAQRVLVGQSLQRYRKLPENTTWAEGQADFLALPDYLEVAELDKHALTAYSLLEKDGVMPFDLDKKLLEVGYHPMAWVLGPDLDGKPLWSVKRGFNTYGKKEDFYPVIAVRQTQSHGLTLLGYDTHLCLNTSLTLPDGCETRVDKIDYRLMQPVRIIDPNQNVKEALHGAFGQVLATSFHGTEHGVPVGFKPISNYHRPEDDSPATAIEAPDDALQDAATAYFENPFSWMGRVSEHERQDTTWISQCVTQGDLLPSGYVRASVRWLLATDELTPARQRLLALLPKILREPTHAVGLQADRYPEDPEKQIRMAISCWDGFGRSLQTKHKVEDGYAYKMLEDGTLALEGGKPVTLQDVERWRVSERVEYNNKGLTVRVYRPYFAQGWRYINDASLRQHGYHDKQFYDPLGRPTNTVLAKEGYLRRVTYRGWYTINEDENDTYEEVMAAKARPA